MNLGIYTLANDVVYDQLVALLNSIEVNASREIPVCVIPYNDQLDKVRAEVARRSNVTLFEDQASIAYWENFAAQAWQAHTKAQKIWKERGIKGIYRIERHRKYCCFDGPFEKFIFFDADTLLMGSIDDVEQKLDEYGWVTNDFQHRADWNFVLDCSEPKLLEIFSRDYLESHIFCSGWFASKKGVFTRELVASLEEKLKSGEAAVMAWQDSDQTLLNYMVLRSGISYYNYAYHGTTGNNCYSKYDVVDNVLYDKGRRITYLHYMAEPAEKFTQICQGEDVEIPYRDVFLHYRYLKTPEERPQLARPNLLVRSQRIANSFFTQKITNAKHKIAQLKNKLSGNFS